MKKLILALVISFALATSALATVNINTATKEELMNVKGIGEKRAQEIINYRKKNGDFKSVDDLEKVPGVGPGIMKQIRSQVTVTGKTTTEKAVDKGTPAKISAPAKSKGTEAKKTEVLKGDATKSDTAKLKTAEKSKGVENKSLSK